MKTQLIQIPHFDYLINPAYGSSDIIKMSKSFAYWKFRKENPEPQSRALVIGSVTHLLLEQELRTRKKALNAVNDVGIRVYEEGSSRTKGFEKFAAENKSSYCLDLEESSLCNRMVRALLDEPEVMGYLKDAIAEPTLIGKYPDTDILCKCRPDYLHMEKGVSINLKTTNDASESGFIYSARDFGYDYQSAFYCDLLTHHLGRSFDEIHILVEKTDEKEPPRIKIFSFGDDTLSFARTQIQTLLERIPECEKTGVWPNSKVYLETVDLPMYSRRIVNL